MVNQRLISIQDHWGLQPVYAYIWTEAHVNRKSILKLVHPSTTRKSSLKKTSLTQGLLIFYQSLTWFLLVQVGCSVVMLLSWQLEIISFIAHHLHLYLLDNDPKSKST